MCGIVGMVAKTKQGFFSSQRDIFEEMLLCDSVRGDDSTGTFVVTNKNQVSIVKQAVSPGIFLQTKSWKTSGDLIYQKGVIAVGHNRKATFGEVVSKNAHPFIRNNIVLIHNGFIGNHKDIDSSVAVDSEAIITALSEEKEPEKALERLVGAWTIVWYNYKTKKLYLVTNGERPLALTHTSDHLYFASENKMVEWVLDRNKVVFQPSIQAMPHLLYEISWPKFNIKTTPVKKREIKTNSYHPKWPVYHENEVDDVLDGAFGFSHKADAEFELDEKHPLDRETTLIVPHKHEDEEEHLVKTALRLYPPGSTALFVPTNQAIEGKQAVVFGNVWCPGHPVFRARTILSKDTDDHLIYNWNPKRPPLLCEIAFLQRRDKDLKFSVCNVREPSSTLQDVNGQEMSEFEWHLICESEACNKCAKAPLKQQPDFTAINRSNGEYDVTCTACLSEATTPKKLDTDKPSVNEHTYENRKSEYGS